MDLRQNISTEMFYVQTLYKRSFLNSLIRLQPFSNRHYCLKHINKNKDHRLDYLSIFQLCFVWLMYIRLFALLFIRKDSETAIWFGHNFSFLRGATGTFLLGIALIILGVASFSKTLFQWLLVNDSFSLILHLHQLSPQASEEFLRKRSQRTETDQSFQKMNVFRLQKPDLKQRLPRLKFNDLATKNHFHTRPYLCSQLALEQNFFSLCLTKQNFVYYSTIVIFIQHFCAILAHLFVAAFCLLVFLSGIHLISIRLTVANILLQLFWQITNIYFLAVIVYIPLHIDFLLIIAMFLICLRLEQMLATASSICLSKKSDLQMLWVLCHQIASCQRLTRDMGAIFAVFMGIAYFTVSATTSGLVFVSFFHSSDSISLRITTLGLILSFYFGFSLIMISAANVNWKVSKNYFKKFISQKR